MNKAARLNLENRNDEAEIVFLEAKKLAEKLYSKDHPNYANLMGEMADLYHDLGRFAQAKVYYEEAVRVLEITKGKKSLDYILGINNLAYLMEDLGEYEQAEQLFRNSLKLRKQFFSKDSMRVASSTGNLARLLTKIGNYEESQDLLELATPVFIEKNKSILGLEITQLANRLKSDPSFDHCNSSQNNLTDLIKATAELSEQNWRRIYYEYWLGELSVLCGYKQQAMKLLVAAKTSAEQIYTPNSIGQQLVNQKVDALIKEISK